jgi:hypothetical protein
MLGNLWIWGLRPRDGSYCREGSNNKRVGSSSNMEVSITCYQMTLARILLLLPSLQWLPSLGRGPRIRRGGDLLQVRNLRLDTITIMFKERFRMSPIRTDWGSKDKDTFRHNGRIFALPALAAVPIAEFSDCQKSPYFLIGPRQSALARRGKRV